MDITHILLAFTLIGSKWVLYLLIFLSVVSIAFMIDRYLFFSRQTRELNPFLDDLAQLLEEREIQQAQELSQFQGGVEGRVALVGLRNLDRERAVLEERLTGAQVEERIRMERKLL